jgi:diguanylate cyclase
VRRRRRAWLAACILLAALVQILVRLGKELRLETIAERIEEQQPRALRRQRCDRGHDFLYAPPLDAGAIAQLIEGGQRPAATESRRQVAAGREAS